jgi:hypothetical protein
MSLLCSGIGSSPGRTLTGYGREHVHEPRPPASALGTAGKANLEERRQLGNVFVATADFA